MAMKTIPKIGLALSGGSFRGLAHIGVLQSIIDAGIDIDVIAGTSMGSMIAGVYASGADMDMCAKLVMQMDERDYFDPAMRKKGWFKGDRFQELAKTLTKDLDFDQLNIPLAVVACDIQTGEKVVFREGKVHEAIRASVSLPMIFTPHHYQGRILVDGGVVDRMPAGVVRKDLNADIVIAVDVGYRGDPTKEPESTREVIQRSLDIMGWEITKLQSKYYDVLVRPDVRHMPGLKLTMAEECILAGQKAGMEAAPLIIEAIERFKIKA